MSRQDTPDGRCSAYSTRSARDAHDQVRYRDDAASRPDPRMRGPASNRNQPATWRGVPESDGGRPPRNGLPPRRPEKVLQPQEPEGEPARRWWKFLVPLTVFAAVVSLLIPAGRHQWAVSLFRQPAHYTVLFFNSASSLPSSARFNQPVAFSFTIGNREGQDTNYRYVINESAAGLTQKLAGSNSVVRDGKTWTVSTAIRPSCITSPCEIEVSLPGHPETIDFLLTLKTGQ